MKALELRLLASRFVLGLLAAGLLAGGSISAQAFTLIPFPRPTVSVTPTSGLPTATFSIRGKQGLPGVACPVGAPAPTILFKFFWYKVIGSKVQIWTKTTNNCANVGTTGVIDTGASPALTPPSPLNYPSTFVIQVATYNASTGAPLSSTYTNTVLYRVIAPKPSPSPSPKVTPPCGQVGAAPCPSPSPSPCTVGAAGFMPSGFGDRDAAVMLALVIFGTLPIGGIVMFSTPGAWDRRRWCRVLALLGISMILLTASGCTAIRAPQGEASPTQSEPSPSPSPSPTC